VHVDRTVLHYGKGEENPVLSMRFLDFQQKGAGGGGGGGGGGVRVARQMAPREVGGLVLWVGVVVVGGEGVAGGV
jgi:hypothetical protein